MAEFKQGVLTAQGTALLAKVQAGKANITFTKFQIGDGAWPSDTSQATLIQTTALKNKKGEYGISKAEYVNDATSLLTLVASNINNTTAGYYIREVGVFATDGTTEVLYAIYITEPDKGDWFPAYNSITPSSVTYQCPISVANAASVTVNANSGGVATQEEMNQVQDKIADLQGYVGYSDDGIYGVEADFVNKRFTRLAAAVGKTGGADFDSIKAFGGRRRCNLADDGTVNAYYGDEGYAEDGTNGQVMVEQPAYYYKVVPLQVEKAAHGKGYVVRKARYYVSDTPHAGFKYHPAFVVDETKLDKIFLAAFEGSVYDTSAAAYILDDAQVADFAADMLSSIAGAKPASGLTQNLTRGNTRKLAQKRGSGWEQSYAHTISATQMLMLIEYASFNMQAAIGDGAVNKKDDGATNMAEPTGTTSSLGNASGVVTNANGIKIVSYRGEENLWGNIWKWMDGMNISNPTSFTEGMAGNVYVADHGFADDISAAPYKDTGFGAAFSNWAYISAFAYSEEFDWLFIPSETKGNSSLPVGDCYQNINTGWRVARLGAGWNYGSAAGPFFLGLDSSSGNRGRFLGGRLVYRKLAA